MTMTYRTKEAYQKLVDEYEKKYYGNGNRHTIGQIYAGDIASVFKLADERSKGSGNYFFQIASIALKAGIMIGYRVRRTEERREKAGNRRATAGTE